jgi:hypothetical protein
MQGIAPIEVVETPEFLSAMRRIMDDEERSILTTLLVEAFKRRQP